MASRRYGLPWDWREPEGSCHTGQIASRSRAFRCAICRSLGNVRRGAARFGRFALQGPLRRYGRLKGLGLPDRHRLFFRPFEADGRRLLLILWLGYPRKEGDRNDCYAAFTRMVRRGDFPESWPELQAGIEAG